ncbi:D-alanine aminotransferase [Pseudobythopirellula maris]|uniref:branched-chain-amino-acid transaminase n=1 Tax=Pseudobythopirellula maris TaxID=2527991 RepID=A0A5C5ZPD3_9BACT|nr:aminotransferase class IV [Pseudobythopirellula maris]TWT88975.1 D-alanine aminotransferase [Pseudobythopirellula maris]
MIVQPAYLNGKWIEQADLAIPVDDLGFAMGVTITERLRTFEGRVWRKAEHIQRMLHSARVVGIPRDVVYEIDQAILQMLALAMPTRPFGDDWTIIAFATPGPLSGQRGGEPTRCVHGAPLRFGDWADHYSEGVRLRTTPVRQTPDSCWPSALKCRSRMHYYLADREAAAAEPGARALLLDQQGRVCEASTANVVIFNEAEGIVSPPMERVLPGVSVGVLRELAAGLGVAFTERDLTPEEFGAADEAWLASTSVCLLPVVSLNGEPIGAGEPGPAFGRFLAAWSELVGLDIAEQARRQACLA